MRRARELILAAGGAAHANVFTRITLALFDQVPWRAVPFIPAEIMLLPEWFPFHIKKVSYWSRTVMVPLFVLCTLKPHAENPRRVHIRELFTVPANEERHYFVSRSMLNRVFFALDRVGRQIDALVPKAVRRRAVNVARDWFVERLNGDDGLGGIFPAMVNAHEALKAMGYPPDHEYRRSTREALRRLLVEKEDHASCQPCVSPVWDTSLACLALQAASESPRTDGVLKAMQWLAPRQLLEQPGDWQWKRPHLPGGGWAFEFVNTHYPDIDDTPVVAWAMLNSGPEQFGHAIERAANWIEGMQSSNGGWASFDVDNTHGYLNEIPFADHGALLADGGCHRTLRGFSLPLRPRALRCQHSTRHRLHPPGAGGQRKLVRSLGHKLHLRDLVRAHRLRAGRRGSRLGAGASRRCLVAGLPARGRRLGRRQPELLRAGACGQSQPQHQLPDRLGPARPGGGRRAAQ